MEYEPEEDDSSGISATARGDFEAGFDEKISHVNPDEFKHTLLDFVDKMFAPDGFLQQAATDSGRKYEFRIPQKLMAQRIAASLGDCRNLCVEAPTGVGKSFAYLTPVIKFAQYVSRPVIISTETINLQEQLIEKDLPLLRKATNLDFSACLAKGRSNYLCLRRLNMLTDDRKEQLLPLRSMQLELERVAEWSTHSADGDPDVGNFNVDLAVWGMVCSESGNCLASRCAYFRRCFYFKARQRWEKADIIVANHALFLTDLKMRQSEDLSSALLPSYSAVIVDEAHTLEDSAADHLGLAVSQIGMLAWLNRLFAENGRGLLMHKGEEELELRGKVTELRSHVRSFFRFFAEYVHRQNRNDTIRRIETPDIFPDTVSEPLAKLRKGLQTLVDKLDSDEDAKDYCCELDAQLSRCDAYLDAIADFLSMSQPDSVYWAEENREAMELRGAPINVAALLKQLLFELPIPVILTSATLTVENKFDYYLNRVGFDAGETLQLESPFLPEQVKLLLPQTMPEPAEPAYPEALANKVVQAVRLTHGKAFVLFTSYQQMRDCAESLRSFFNDEGILMLVQGDDLRRSAMLRKFKEDVNSVLFGVDSFWTGVDVPGEALSNVIVAKLPFAVPSHPLIQARCEELEKRKQNPFMHYSLPEAVLKFRQGVGRLIRSQSDRGYIVILDRRILSKRYGKTFLNSMPKYPVEYI